MPYYSIFVSPKQTNKNKSHNEKCVFGDILCISPATLKAQSIVFKGYVAEMKT